jgi:hypothetical protein
MSGNTDEVLGVLREVWNAQGQTAEDIEEACGGPAKSCKRMTDVGFEGLAEETDGDLRLAWRTQLAREGKLNRGEGSVRDLVLRPASGADEVHERHGAQRPASR